ncbi:hypothetical protein E4U30_005020 [Claviceps sp. LM220 group G6]|nr:hypothetical protein E4U30_005020 [Claviceps sp. LM220 group G6]
MSSFTTHSAPFGYVEFITRGVSVYQSGDDDDYDGTFAPDEPEHTHQMKPLRKRVIPGARLNMHLQMQPPKYAKSLVNSSDHIFKEAFLNLGRDAAICVWAHDDTTGIVKAGITDEEMFIWNLQVSRRSYPYE